MTDSVGITKNVRVWFNGILGVKEFGVSWINMEHGEFQ